MQPTCPAIGMEEGVKYCFTNIVVSCSQCIKANLSSEVLNVLASNGSLTLSLRHFESVVSLRSWSMLGLAATTASQAALKVTLARPSASFWIAAQDARPLLCARLSSNVTGSSSTARLEPTCWFEHVKSSANPADGRPPIGAACPSLASQMCSCWERQFAGLPPVRDKKQKRQIVVPYNPGQSHPQQPTLTPALGSFKPGCLLKMMLCKRVQVLVPFVCWAAPSASGHGYKVRPPIVQRLPLYTC